MSFMEAIERGLASTQLESALLEVLVLIVCILPLPLNPVVARETTDGVAEEDVDDLPRPPREGLGDSSTRNRLGVNGGRGAAVFEVRPWAATPSRLLFLSSVARSGLLAVPCERYIERRFVWRSVSSSAS